MIIIPAHANSFFGRFSEATLHQCYSTMQHAGLEI
jgi:hypothetical protein